ncbi:MAG: flippase-like domain-containing protein [Phycisphaerales bacterium]|nr:MAG: flippase-like domain-containing protein [Phycisphaerales bacterium]
MVEKSKFRSVPKGGRNGMKTPPKTQSHSVEGPVTRNLLGSWLLSALVSIVLVVSLIWAAGVWEILANTRLLNFLISFGIVQYHDVQHGLVEGVADHRYYLMSEDPIDWRLVGLCACMYFGFWIFKAIQCHSLARHFGLKGSFGDHGRAWMYGEWHNRFLPLQFGNAATAAAFESQGESLANASAIIYIQDVYIIFEIIFFALLGLVLTGWTIWFNQLFWPCVMFVAFFLITRSLRRKPDPEHRAQVRAAKWQVLRRLANDPLLLVKCAVLSLLAFFADDVAPYAVSMGFTSDNVLLNTNFLFIQAGVVGGYIARRFPIAMGGIGQYMWGFALAVYMSGVAMPAAATIALLDFAVRYSALLFVFVVFVMWKGVKTSFPAVAGLYNRAELAQKPAAT